MNATLTINDTEKKPVNPLIFGHFVEFMRDCIDEGMWAQLLKNRSFEISEHIKDGIPDFWCRTGCKDTYRFEQDWSETVSREGCSLKMISQNHYDGFIGTAQEGICIQKNHYRGYLWMKSDRKVPVSIEIYEKSGKTFLSKALEVCGEWKKYSFEFDSEDLTFTGIFEIRLRENGTLWVDSASLMPSDTENGIWKEVMEAIRRLFPSVIRFPGGCFADCYHWEDGIGERDSRPTRKNLHWGGYEDNSFGTDEYMEFCRLIGCEPMICINFGSGTPEEAANWVEYCNGALDTPYGSLRAKNGHPDPYRIKYWDIGNEIFGDWEIGHVNADEYAEKYLTFYEAMKQKDPSITFMICGGDGDSTSQAWNQKAATRIGQKMNAVCLHMYAQKELKGSHDNRDIYYATAGSVIKYEKILKNSLETVRKNGCPSAMAAITEYNVGTIIDTYREQTLEAAIFNAGMLNMFLRNTEKLAMCNLSDLVNGWPGGCIVSKNGHTFGTTTYHTVSMYAGSKIRHVIHTELCCPVYETKERIGNIEPLSHVPYVDAAGCIGEDGKLILFVVNRSCEEELTLEINMENCPKQAEITELTSDKTSDMNDFGRETIKPVTYESTLRNRKILLKKNSINRIILP